MVVNVVLHICKIDVVLEYVIVYLKPPNVCIESNFRRTHVLIVCEKKASRESLHYLLMDCLTKYRIHHLD